MASFGGDEIYLFAAWSPCPIDVLVPPSEVKKDDVLQYRTKVRTYLLCNSYCEGMVATVELLRIRRSYRHIHAEDFNGVDKENVLFSQRLLCRMLRKREAGMVDLGVHIPTPKRALGRIV